MSASPPPPFAMSMFTDMANVSAIGRINKHSFWLAAAGHLCVNFEIRGAGSELSKHRRHRDECLFIRHRYLHVATLSLASSGRPLIRPISLLRFSLLRFVDSTIPGDSLWTWKFHPLNLRLLDSNPPKSRILIRRLAAGDAGVLPEDVRPRRLQRVDISLHPPTLFRLLYPVGPLRNTLQPLILLPVPYRCLWKSTPFVWALALQVMWDSALGGPKRARNRPR